MKKLGGLMGVALLGLILWFGVGMLRNRAEIEQRIAQQDLPEAVTFQEITDEILQEEAAPVVIPVDEVFIDIRQPEPLPASVNLAVPFTSQAPHANWDFPYQEACEEASVLMAAGFFGEVRHDFSPDDADRSILNLVALQEELFGYYEDTTVQETIRFAREAYPALTFEMIEEPTINAIENALAGGSLVIVPAAGKQLGNPFFSGEGPLYHMLVLRGYTATGFVTNDPGTRHGESFVYQKDIIMQAMGDWNGGSPSTGNKVVIVVSK